MRELNEAIPFALQSSSELTSAPSQGPTIAGSALICVPMMDDKFRNNRVQILSCFGNAMKLSRVRRRTRLGYPQVRTDARVSLSYQILLSSFYPIQRRCC